jgi:hypothetical protein
MTSDAHLNGQVIEGLQSQVGRRYHFVPRNGMHNIGNHDQAWWTSAIAAAAKACQEKGYHIFSCGSNGNLYKYAWQGDGLHADALGRQASTLAIIQALLIHGAQAPTTIQAGGTSKLLSAPDIDIKSAKAKYHPASTAAAVLLTSAVIVTIIGGAWWLKLSLLWLSSRRRIVIRFTIHNTTLCSLRMLLYQTIVPVTSCAELIQITAYFHRSKEHMIRM